jgi:hypothetical protein
MLKIPQSSFYSPSVFCLKVTRLLSLAEKMKIMSVATFGSEQLSCKLRTAHIESFQLTRSVVFVGSTAVVNRVALAQSHKATGVLRLWVSYFIFQYILGLQYKK